MKIGLTILLSTVVAFSTEGFSMAKRYTHFVDSNYEGKVIHGQPTGQKGTRWWYEHADFHVIVNYPADHRTDWPLKQWLTLQVGDNPPKKGKFQVNLLKITDAQNKEIPIKFGAKNYGDYRSLEFDAYAHPIVFFTDIPKNVQSLTLEFKIEIKMQDGQTHIVEESIPLRRAYFEIGLFEKDAY